jgi:hypothetical protein
MSFLSRIFGSVKNTALSVVSGGGASKAPASALEAFSPPIAARAAEGRGGAMDTGLPIALDGFVADALITHPSGSRFMGEDKHGNKYYEKEQEIYGRHRFVIYKDLWNYNAGSVPPEYHHW